MHAISAHRAVHSIYHAQQGKTQLKIMAAVTATKSTPNTLINALFTRYHWSDSALTYSFPDANSSWSTSSTLGYGPKDGSGEPWSAGFSALSTEKQTVFSQILGSWSQVAKLSFSQVADNAGGSGTLRVAETVSAAHAREQAWTYYPTSGEQGGDIWINPDLVTGTGSWVAGNYGYFAILHELGHALGLKHPFDDFVNLPSSLDYQSLTIMSYYAAPGETGSKFSYFPTTPMTLDIAAIQAIYGTNTSYLSGDTTHHFDDSQTYHQTVWDAGGNDTLEYSGQRSVTMSLQAGAASRIGNPVYIVHADGSQGDAIDNVWIAYNCSIENLRAGSGNDRLSGNTADNLIDGGGGLDTFICSGKRADYQLQSRQGDWLLSSASDGTDTLHQVERLHFSDGELALDVGPGGNAARAADIIATVAYDLVKAPGVAGSVLASLDAGLNELQIFQNALQQGVIRNLAGDGSDLALAQLIVRNVLGSSVDPQYAASLAAMMQGQGGAFSQAEFLVLACNHQFNLDHVALLGISQNGLAYF